MIDRRALLAAAAAGLAIPAWARAPRFDLAAIERKRVVPRATALLDEAPRTIVAICAPRSPGDSHDYYSEGDYWWPDLAHPDGPYIRRDGLSYPNKFDAHRDALIAFSVTMPMLAAAWELTGEARFARAAARHLDAWFVDPETRMRPDLRYAQAVIGRNTGRSIGIIDTLQLVDVARAARRMIARRAPGLDSRTRAGVLAWFGDYTRWLTHSPPGVEEGAATNNHGTAWLLQVAAFADLIADADLCRAMAERLTRAIIPRQIAPDGRQPLELARTKPFNYSLFNLDLLAAATQLLARYRPGLWRFHTADGRSVAAAVAFMMPYIRDRSAWPFVHDVEHFDDLPVRQPSLLFAGLALDRPAYLALWRRLDADPMVPEIVRNFPVRQPIFWV